MCLKLGLYIIRDTVFENDYVHDDLFLNHLQSISLQLFDRQPLPYIMDSVLQCCML
jgi:hypothetical protein